MKFDCTATGYRRPVNQKVDFVFSVKKDPSPPKHIGEELFQERSVITHEIAYAFHSNAAQLPHNKKLAIDAVYAALFKDMIPIIKHILVNYDNDEEVRQSAGHLLKMMIEPSYSPVWEQNDE